MEWLDPNVPVSPVYSRLLYPPSDQKEMGNGRGRVLGSANQDEWKEQGRGSWETGGVSKGLNYKQWDLQPGLPLGCTRPGNIFVWYFYL